MKMNKEKFTKKLKEVTGYDDEKVNAVAEVLGDTFIIGKNNKEKMLDGFQEKLEINREKANELYNKAMEIITKEIKDKILHPLRKDEE